MKSFTLFKRDANGDFMPATAAGYRDRPWHFRFEYRGRTYSRTLETTDATEAQRRARLKWNEIRNAIQTGEFDRLDATKTRHPIHATLAELHAAYRTAPVRATAQTREKNINATLNLLKRVTGQTADQLLHTPFPKLLNGDTAEAWFKLELAGVTPHSMNSLWRQAASVCNTDGATYTYKKQKILHPCLEDFARTGLVCQKHVSRVAARPPSDEIIARTLEAWSALEERNLFLAIGHELAFGLRAGEVGQAKVSWWSVKYGTPMLCATGTFKHNPEGYFEQPALDPFYTTLRTKALARGWLRSGDAPAPSDDYLITGTPTYRADGIEREVSAFLRAQGWETKKTNHALRAYAGSLVCLKYGVYKAKEFLRHSSVKVTEQHYLYLMKHPLVDTIRDACPAQWATVAATAPILTLVERSA